MVTKKGTSISTRSFLILALIALVMGGWYRLPELQTRPMHTDEAILGMKLADYWNSGRFEYDPRDYHGPALHQVSGLWGRLAGWGDPATWTEARLRTVTAICGLLLLLVTMLFIDALGRLGTAMAMLLAAVSPLMVFYSRYFIMEMLLVLLVALMLGCFWRYAQGGTKLWLILGGCALGFQHATKETFVIAACAALCGWAAARMLVGSFEPRKASGLTLGPARARKPARPVWLWVLVPAVVVSVTSYSCLFKDWQAVLDSVTTYKLYLERSGGSGHEKPWHYYLTLLFWRKDTVVWTEAMVGLLALVGMGQAFLGQHRSTARHAFMVFLSIFTLAQLTVYSILPYKTPWCILSAAYGLILLAGAGTGVIWNAFSGKISRILQRLLIVSGLYHLCAQTMLAIGPYRADQRNPYVYAHTTTSLMPLVARVLDLATLEPHTLTVQVISRDAGWPLRWYWQNLPRIGYHTSVPDDLTASVIVCDADLMPVVEAKLAGRSCQKDSLYGLRPNVYLQVLIEQSLWDRLMASKQKP